MKSLVLVLICLTLHVFAEDKKDIPAKPQSSSAPVRPMDAHMESRQVFVNAMENPIAAEIFRQDQLSKFSTPFDQEMRTFFSRHEVFGQIFNLFIKNYNAILEDFSNEMLIDSTRLRRGMTADYDRLLKIIQETAIDLGFNEKAARNVEVYVKSGAENAYTVSGLQNRIIIVFQRDILRTMSVGEIRAVVGHELGHIRAQHVITGQLNSVLLTLLNVYLVNGSNEISAQDIQEEIIRIEKTTGESLIEKFTSVIEMHHVGKHHTNVRRKYGVKNPHKMQINAELNMFMSRFMAQPHELKRTVFLEYLDILIRNLKATESLSTTIEFFESVAQDFQERGFIRGANPEEVASHLRVASLAISQAFETTSDMISNSVVKRSYLASAMAKLLGADFNGSGKKTGYEDRQERDRIIQGLLEQAAEFRERNKGDDAARFLSATTHPWPVIRVEQIMGLEKYPAIMFADPLMRDLYLHDLVSLQVVELESKIQQIRAAEAQVTVQGAKKSPQLLAAKKGLTQAFIALAKQRKALGDAIKTMMLNPDKGGVTSPYKALTEEIEKLDGSKEEQTRVRGRAPRFETHVRYLAVYRRELSARIQELQDLAKQYPQNAEFFEYNVRLLKTQYVDATRFVRSLISAAAQQAAQANLDKDSLNLINGRLLYLEKVGTKKLSSEEFSKILGEVQASIVNGKDLPLEQTVESKLFTEDKFPLRIILPKAEVAGSCLKYFSL